MRAELPGRLADISREGYIYLGAGAAVLLQLAQPGVGAGVVTHTSTLRRPLDRLRTTMTYLYGLTLGTEAERRLIGRLVSRAHAPVRGPGYSALDPQLQLWVAATLYRGGAQLAEIFHGPLPADRAESLYQQAAVYGTTLQMPRALWPADLAAFERYWEATLEACTVNEAVRDFVHRLLAGEGVPWWLRPLMPLQRFLTRALLPPRLRASFGLAWSARDEHRWQRFQRWAPPLYWALPAWLRQAPARWVLRDMRRRMAAGSHLI